ncbi:MAG: AmmeMemoRadiSam system protein A [Clostridiaceae bacterium]|nr:AmmeMemoRadiSam system protein A [Clostridiaceae bacterium]
MGEKNPVLAGFITPHPPVIVPGVSPGKMLAGKTVEAMNQLAADLSQLKPDTLVLISPHAPLFSDYVFFYEDQILAGDLASFGAPEVKLSFPKDQALQEQIIRRLGEVHLAAGCLSGEQMQHYHIERKLDHGALVPLYFLSRLCSFQLVVLSSADLSLPDLYLAGRQIRQAADDLGRRIVIVASGDQSHKVNPSSPYGAVPAGAVYDREITEAVMAGDLVRILSLDPMTRQQAAECGYRSLVILCGALAGYSVRGRLLSYEAPYGIGYCVAGLTRDPARQDRIADALDEALRRIRDKETEARRRASPPVVIARETLEHYVKQRKRLTAADFQAIIQQESWLNDQAGVFVSLKKFGSLRGCIGTTMATTTSITEEIIQNAISAGTGDPRFEPVGAGELADLVYSVDILEKPEPVDGEDMLDPAVYGVIVQNGSRSGLLLPDLEGVDTVQEQLAIACRKAGIRPQESYRIQRFRVTRYH